MQFSNTIDKNGIIQQVEANINIGDAGISGDATLFAQFTAQINNYYSRATNIIITANGVWLWDDTNHDDLARATTDLISGQSDYQVLSATPAADKDWLEVSGVNQTAGIEILFNRAPLYFTVTDTTKRPGFNTLYHEYLVLGATYWWEKFKGVGNPEQTKRDIAEIENEMGKFYNNRNKYEPTRVRRARGRLR